MSFLDFFTEVTVSGIGLKKRFALELLWRSHLLSRHVHVPDDDAAVRAARDELASVWRIAQALHFLAAGDHKHTIECTSLINKEPLSEAQYTFVFVRFI